MPAGALFVSISAPCVWPAMTSPAVLLVADLLHPIDGRAVQLFLDSDVAHGSGRAGAMPVLFAGREPDDVARADLLNGAALTLHQPEAGVVRALGWIESIRPSLQPRALVRGRRSARR